MTYFVESLTMPDPRSAICVAYTIQYSA